MVKKVNGNLQLSMVTLRRGLQLQHTCCMRLQVLAANVMTQVQQVDLSIGCY